MAPACPHCQTPIHRAHPKPGRYRARCPKCASPFRLVIPAEPDAEWTVRPLDAEPPRVPGYRIIREIGRGGMGTVYLARQLDRDRAVALKVMGQQWVGDPTFCARFVREAAAAARIDHPNVVRVFDAGEADGTRYMSMEYVAGRSLADVVAEGPLDPKRAVGYVLQAARGLRQAHRRGFVHRDIKPDNLLVDDHGTVKVIDLGLVKALGPARDNDPNWRNITGARMALGTPAYMAPEQCRDSAVVDHRADVYALGATLYVLVTGRQPFDGDTAVELMTKQAYAPLVPPEVHVSGLPLELSLVIQQMMEKDPADRFADMGQVVSALGRWSGERQRGGLLAALGGLFGRG